MKNARTSNVLSMHRAVSVEFIRQSGGYAVKAKKGQKDPARGWDPKLASEGRSNMLLAEIAESDDNLGVHLHGPLVDVDIDTDSHYLMDALEMFLPSCPHIWGRPSRPRTHRAYVVKEGYIPSDWPVLPRLKRIPEVKVEIRGGPTTRGEYSLLPGSIHPDEEMYEWHDISTARSSPAVASIKQLVKAIRLAGAIAVLAPYWQKGLRNDLTMALSGFLARIHSIAAGLSEEMFALDKDEARSFLEVLFEVAGDDKEDLSARMKTFEQTWKKSEDGSPVTGGATIAELTGDSAIVNKLYVLLTDSKDIPQIEEFTSRFAIWQGPGVVIDMDATARGEQKPILTRVGFSNSYGHCFVDIGGKSRLLADVLFHLKTTTRVHGMTFEPGEDLIVEKGAGTKLVNQWVGFEIPPWDQPVTAEEVAPFLNYIHDIVAWKNKDTNHWVLAWLSHIFKYPGTKAGTALVLVGLPGAGKSILGHSILVPIIGQAHAAATNTIDSVVKNFNVTFDNKLFIQCDEATNNRQKGVAAKLKSLITDPMKVVEPKGIDAYLKPNHSRFLFTSNDVDDAMYLSDGQFDRRYTVLEVCPHHREDVVGYWTPFVKWLKDKDNLARIHRYLVDYEYEFTTVTRPLVTDTKISMQQRSWDPFDGWMASWLARGHPLAEKSHEYWFDAPVLGSENIERTWPELIHMGALVRDFIYYCREYNKRGVDILNERQIAHMLIRKGLKSADDAGQRLGVVEVYDERKKARVRMRPRVYAMPSMNSVRDYLSDKYGFTMDSMDDNFDGGQTDDTTEY